MEQSDFRLTYATMFNPPESLHERFEKALVKTKADLGKEHGMLIDGQECFTEEKTFDTSPANADVILGVFQKGSAKDAERAVAAARKAFPAWSRMDWTDRVSLMRKAAALVRERTVEMGVATALSVGKNRMEALGEVAETADLIDYACDQMEKNHGFIAQMGQDPIKEYVSLNTSVLRPYGVWLVISPFNYPVALTGGPSGAALVAGNTVVTKPCSDTPWPVRLFADCCSDAGVPSGVFNYITGPGHELGDALIANPQVDGVTFTGSYDVGMKIHRDRSQLDHVRPTILEMGGKNPTIVSRNADPDIAALGIMRSAFGLQGQKCSACSRAYVEGSMYERVVDKLVELTGKIVVGDPTRRDVYMGPVINKTAYNAFKEYVDELSKVGTILVGGETLAGAEHANGNFCKPTVVADVPWEHRLWTHEMFVPILLVTAVQSLTEAMQHANDTPYGLTAGFYGSPEEVQWFFEHIEAGVAYANRPAGATTGAWPGFQPFGGWKGSGASGKNSGGLHYVQLYMREQIQNRVE
jgi:1-pyrroline-5-carboxylate dehydrogenase